MNRLLNSIESKNKAEMVLTREGEAAHATIETGKVDVEGVLPFFTLAAGMRGDSVSAINLFNRAYDAHPLMAVRALFYLRYFRRTGVTGNGERKTFRKVFAHLATRNDELGAKLVRHIPEFGRWDDVLVLVDGQYKFSAPLTREAAVSLVQAQLKADIKAYKSGQAVSLLAKWMPSENASSEKSKAMAKFLARRLGMRLEEYRVTMKTLRQEIGIVESLISKKRFDKIDYARVPASAHKIYSSLFMKKDTNRYQHYLAQVAAGKSKVNTTGLQAHQITMASMGLSVQDVMWQDMLNQFDVNLSVLPAIDSSASMENWRFYGNRNAVVGKSPQEIAVSLGAFFSELNEGAFKNWVINFQTRAKMFKVIGQTLRDRIDYLSRMSSDHGMTNVNKVHELVLTHACDVGASEEDMPDVIMILSDMQFTHSHMYGGNKTAYEKMREAYKAAGYEMPVVIFWNIDAVPDNSPIKADDMGTIMVNGFSQDVLRQILRMSRRELQRFTPAGMMVNALTSEPYSSIVLE